TSGYYLYDKNGQIVIKNSEIIYNDSRVRLYDVAGLKEQYKWKHDKVLMGALAFTPDGRGLLAGASDPLIRQWDPAKPAPEPEGFYKGGNGGAATLACSPDGRWLAAYRPGYRLPPIDPARGHLLPTH